MENEIIKCIEKISGQYNPHQVFTDWVQCMALATQNTCWMNHDKYWKEREDAYLATIGKYKKEEQKMMCEMHGMLTECFEKEIKDYLGEIYMKSGAGSKQTGQFFTPFHLAELTAGLTIEKITEEKTLVINEPASGGGGMILGAAKYLKNKGINYQRCMKVVAQDLDWNGVYMTYVQLSITGIKAMAVQGDSLRSAKIDTSDRRRVLYTPAYMGALM